MPSFNKKLCCIFSLVREDRNSNAQLRIIDWLDRPQILEDGDKFDELSRGLNTQSSHGMDQFHDSSVTQFLFRDDNETFGIDLKAFDIQRSRDHGIASYNSFRESWGLQKAHSFSEFLDLISEEVSEEMRIL